jgi:O-antigen/teichoic acid export membrane protein
LLGFVIIFSAKDIIGIVYGNMKYYDAIPILRVFGAIIIIRYSVEVPALMLTTSNRQFVRMLLVISATVINYGINRYAIPNYGALGAAYTSLATNLLIGIGYFIAIRNRAPENWFTKERLLPLFIILIGGIIMIYDPIPIWSGILVITAIYIVIVFYMGYSTKEKALLFKNVISPNLS